MNKHAKMNATQILSLHLRLLDRISEIEFLNNGGCGFFVYYLQKILQSKGYRSDIICLYDKDDIVITKGKHLDNIENIRRRKRKDIFAYSHFCLKIGRYHFDSSGMELSHINPVFNMYKVIGSISLNDLKYILKLREKWVSIYDRGQNKRMKRIIVDAAAIL
ncbi:hypothetical protein [Sphingobacterium yanglingense]|uniref:Uncharacterized protein n=1 Tax=Sphingobacterium yanglingense TaxID=1437280 RepID=A0A4R6W9G6_9SPHI|nr:hypothetical protein [Sphingobacterium yanglingense]TDQ73839.1 hypothetical protein CLV99_4276 [Sphingobacterium yanglingense]